MGKMFNNDILDKGLEQIGVEANWGGGILRLVVCAGEPVTQSEAATLFPTGKRISDEIILLQADVTLGNKTGGGREITIIAKNGTAQVAVPLVETGNVSSATSNTLTDTLKSWVAAAYAGKVIKITSGFGAEQATQTIVSNTGDTITIPSNWNTQPDNTSTYEIYEDLHLAIYDGGTPRLLMVTNELTDQAILDANTINIPSFKFGFAAPV